MILPIRAYGDPILQEQSSLVTENSESIQKLINNMILTMRHAEGAGPVASVLQHENDHLNGVLHIDYLSKFRRKLIEGRADMNSGWVHTEIGCSVNLSSVTKNIPLFPADRFDRIENLCVRRGV